MDRYGFRVGKVGFEVVDNETGKTVLVGNFLEVQDFLDHQENVLRIEKEKNKRKRDVADFSNF